MAICAVFNCSSNNDKRLKRNQDESARTQIKFFKFPKDNIYSKIWLQKCKRSDKVNIKNAYICSKHFKSEHYIRNMQHELLQYSPKSCRKLKLDAVPTENLQNSLNLERTRSHRQERLLKKQNARIVRDILEKATGYVDQPGSNSEVIMSCNNDDEMPINIIDTAKHVDKITSTDSLVESTAKASDIEVLELKARIKEVEKECHFLKEENNCINAIFTPTQRSKLRNNGQRIRWTADDIAKSIAIYSNGPKAYRFLLKQKYPLPAVITLKTWAAKIDINPGFLNVVFNLMDKSNLTSYQRVCTLMADEMKIQRSFEYDQKSDILLAPANYVQVLMARGLFKNWKQPIYYNYDTKLTKTMITTAISKLHEINYHVVAVVSDLGGGNRGLWNEMGINEMRPYFDNPFDSNRKVFVFNDIPHLIKLLRNHFLDTGIVVKNQVLLTKAPLVELYEKQSGVDLKIANRLTLMLKLNITLTYLHLNSIYCNFYFKKYIKLKYPLPID